MTDTNTSNGRTIYLASSFKLSDRIERIYEALTDAGHDIPDVWWNENLKERDLPDEEWYQLPEVAQMANRHWDNIANADTFLLIAPADAPKKYNGATAEFGYAHAHGLDCYTVGALERSAMFDPMTRVDTVDELLEEFAAETTEGEPTGADPDGTVDVATDEEETVKN